MKLYIFRKACLLTSLFSFLLYNCNNSTWTDTKTIPPNQVLNDFYISEVEQLLTALKGMEESSDLEEIKGRYIEARTNFKTIEPILAYLESNSYKFLNAPNILKVEEEDKTNINISDPTGFQVLEEIIYSDDPSIDLIHSNAKKIHARMGFHKETKQFSSLADHNILWMIRDQIVRIALKGITGFDSTVLERSLEDARISYAALQDILRIYSNRFDDAKLYEHWKSIIDLSIEKLEASNFNDFDRFDFIKNHTHRQLALWVETAEDWQVDFPFTKALNNNATSLFSSETFNEAHFSGVANNSDKEELVDLGRQLFNEKKLSTGQTISCATCHDADMYFTDGQTISKGVSRNSPTLYYAALQRGFFYDNRSGSLEGQIIDVINNENEFHSDLDTFEKSLESDSVYGKQFDEFYKDGITEANIRNAIANYIKSFSPFNSKFDKAISNNGVVLNDSEINGFNLFMGKAKCATCHFPPVFNGTVPVNFIESEIELLGVPETKDTINPSIDDDLGRYYVFETENRKHFFKTPTIRNVQYTGPYMHNGVYNTLEEVIDFYNKGGGAGLGLDLEFQTLPPDELNLTKGEIEDLEAFMKSLSDKK